ncbi:hypothetical protein FRAAL1394 [Frankia alni ACN14a]|uniref:Uncharacterized protein n=1 Tax=Frankia alni (strain DSM 45986 / CECT 9034 / ACN14a) TaxID=326424 RepID=Q0RQX0_FRAAA|nr:hypothetical protein FRAAL1394 [Frankia alni ACN14a]
MVKGHVPTFRNPHSRISAMQESGQGKRRKRPAGPDRETVHNGRQPRRRHRNVNPRDYAGYPKGRIVNRRR